MWNWRTRSNQFIPNSEKSKSVKVPDESRKLPEKLEALRSYRKAKNLCFTCGDPWARGHKCPNKVPLHIMEELLEVLHHDDLPDPQYLSNSSPDEEVMLVMTTLTLTDIVCRRTIRLMA